MDEKYNRLIKAINIEKMKLLIRSCWAILFIFWIISLISGEHIVITCNNSKINEICAYIDSNVILLNCVKFIMYSAQCLLVYYAILQKPIFKENSIIIILTIIIIWILKTIFVKYSFASFLDLLCIIPLSIILKKKWYRSVVGSFMGIIFSIISSSIKSISITTVDLSTIPTVVTIIFSLDYYLLSFIYYLYNLKEASVNEQLVMVFQKRKKVENINYYFSNFISFMRNSFSCCASNLKSKEWWKRSYCLIIFGIITYGIIFSIAIFLGKELESLIIVLSFHLFRKKDTKTFHASNDVMCFTISIITFSIINELSLNVQQSLFLSLCLSYLLTTTLYFAKDFIELKTIRPTFIENMTLEELKSKYPNEENIELIYDYIHTKDNKQKFAYDRGYSVRTIQRMIKKIKEKQD